MATKDPYRYFRVEARELIEALNRFALELERSGGGAEPVAQILRNAHTLKGAARVVKHAALAELAHAAEGVLEPYRNGGTVTKEAIDRLLAIVDQMTAALGSLQPADATAPPSAPSVATPARPQPAPELLESLRVDVAEVDSLLDSVSEVQVQMSALRRIAQSADESRQLARSLVEQLAGGGRWEVSPRTRAAAEVLRTQLARHERELAQSLSQMSAELSQVKEIAGRLRLVPVTSLRVAFERAVRDEPEVLDCYYLAGSNDYLIRFVYQDAEDLERFHSQVLTRLPGVVRSNSLLVLRTVKRTTALPV